MNVACTCDKCRKAVELSNDAVALEFLIQKHHLPDTTGRLVYGARHLLPTAHCEGSPSRAQYLPDQPRDVRGYAYVASREIEVRAAYQWLQELARESAV